MPHVTLPPSSPPQKPRLCFIDKPVVVVLIDSGGTADQICLRLSGLAWMFSLSSCPHDSVRFQECLQCLLRGNEELVMVGGSQELILLSSLSLPHFFPSFFIHPLLCVSGLGFRLKQCSSVGDVLDMLASGSPWKESYPRSLFSFYTKWEDAWDCIF